MSASKKYIDSLARKIAELEKKRDLIKQRERKIMADMWRLKRQLRMAKKVVPKPT